MQRFKQTIYLAFPIFTAEVWRAQRKNTLSSDP